MTRIARIRHIRTSTFGDAAIAGIGSCCGLHQSCQHQPTQLNCFLEHCGSVSEQPTRTHTPISVLTAVFQVGLNLVSWFPWDFLPLLLPEKNHWGIEDSILWAVCSSCYTTCRPTVERTQSSDSFRLQSLMPVPRRIRYRKEFFQTDCQSSRLLSIWQSTWTSTLFSLHFFDVKCDRNCACFSVNTTYDDRECQLCIVDRLVWCLLVTVYYCPRHVDKRLRADCSAFTFLVYSCAVSSLLLRCQVL